MKLLALAAFAVASVSMALFAAPAATTPEAPTMVLDMDKVACTVGTLKDKAGKDVPCGSVELVDGKFGKANQLTFTDGHGFMMARAKPYVDWDPSDGFSFWVKGDGSKNWGGIELVDSADYGMRYAYCFSIESKDWVKVTVPWRDLIPEKSNIPFIDAKKGYKPSGFTNYGFGKWWYWRDYAPYTIAVDQLEIERKLPPAAHAAVPEKPGVSKFLAKLKAKQPVTIVTMGDSLSDKKHWANREKLWSEMLAKAIEEKYGSKVTLVNPAMGGTELVQNLVLMPRWLKDTPKPDLVTVWFGYNDFNGGMKGDHFKEAVSFAVDKIRRDTKGSAEVLLMTTLPAKAKWTELEELAQAVRDVAKEKKTGLADVSAEFHKKASASDADKEGYWVNDGTHLGAKGHDVTKDCVLDAIENGK